MSRHFEDRGARKSLDSMEEVPYSNHEPIVNNKVMGPAEWFLLITLSILWGGSFFFGKVAMNLPVPGTKDIKLFQATPRISAL